MSSASVPSSTTRVASPPPSPGMEKKTKTCGGGGATTPQKRLQNARASNLNPISQGKHAVFPLADHLPFRSSLLAFAPPHLALVIFFVFLLRSLQCRYKR